ncbi:hypothetical protein ACHAPT_013048 [Fusarium lateritium]
MTGRSDVSLGLDEVVRELGIGRRSEYYKIAALGTGKSALLYLITDKFRQDETRVLIRTRFLVRGETVWRWPEYSWRWLRPDWNGHTWPLEGEDAKRPRRDTPRVRTGSRVDDDCDGDSSSVRSRTWLDSGSVDIELIDDDDDNANFSDASDRTIVPSRHQRAATSAKRRSGLQSESSISDFVQRELKQQQSKMDERFNSLIDIMEDLCSRGSAASEGRGRKAENQQHARSPNRRAYPICAIAAHHASKYPPANSIVTQLTLFAPALGRAALPG